MAEGQLYSDTTEELFEDAPCGYLTTDVHGVVLRVNRTFEALVGRHRDALVGVRRFQDLLAPGGRIYYETHYAPLLQMQGWVREIAVELVRDDGTRVPVLVNAILRRETEGADAVIRTTVFEATDRRRYEQELLRGRDRDRQIAARLQRSLLDGVLPDDPRAAIGIAYVPADVGLEVGGDWYDAFSLDERTIAIVVGDVVGRGIEAAATMGQLRSAVRALASTGAEPGPLLEALDAYARRHGVGEMATIVVVQIDLVSGRMLSASAGHLPAAVLAPGREPRFLLDGRSAPVDAYLRPTPRPQAEVVLPDGAALVLFTDGLIERVDRPLSDGLDALLTALDERRDLPVDELARDLVETMLADRRTRDDVCAVVARRRLRSPA